jgi:hypothetical protein
VLDTSPFKRSSERHPAKKHGSLIINLERQLQRLPCLIVDFSRGGFRVRGSFRLKRGQLVEVIPDDDPLCVVKCSVVWVGSPGSAQQGEAGLEALN